MKSFLLVAAFAIAVAGGTGDNQGISGEVRRRQRNTLILQHLKSVPFGIYCPEDDALSRKLKELTELTLSATGVEHAFVDPAIAVDVAPILQVSAFKTEGKKWKVSCGLFEMFQIPRNGYKLGMQTWRGFADLKTEPVVERDKVVDEATRQLDEFRQDWLASNRKEITRANLR